MRRGDPWGAPASGPPDITVRGDDAVLAAAVGSHPGARVRFEPSSESDVGRGVGLGPGSGTGATEVPFDLLELDDATRAVNAVVLGVPPDRLGRWHRRRAVVVKVDGRTIFEGIATTVVIATGQFLRGADLVPRGHPGDGRVEVQVYALDPGPRRSMRRRLATGTHLPHPAIVEGSGRRVSVSAAQPWPLEIDGRPADARTGLTATVRAGAWRLLI